MPEGQASPEDPGRDCEQAILTKRSGEQMQGPTGSPIGVMRHLVQLIRRDLKAFLRDRGLKRERESWVVAMILIGIHKLTGDYWFMKMEEEDPPDATAVMFQVDASGSRVTR